MCNTDLLTRSQALDMVKNIIGFPHPSPKKLHWYFHDMEGLYDPKVNFKALAAEIQEKKLVEKMSAVVSFETTDQRRQGVQQEIWVTIQKHLLENEEEEVSE